MMRGGLMREHKIIKASLFEGYVSECCSAVLFDQIDVDTLFDVSETDDFMGGGVDGSTEVSLGWHQGMVTIGKDGDELVVGSETGKAMEIVFQ